MCTDFREFNLHIGQVTLLQEEGAAHYHRRLRAALHHHRRLSPCHPGALAVITVVVRPKKGECSRKNNLLLSIQWLIPIELFFIQILDPDQPPEVICYWSCSRPRGRHSVDIQQSGVVTNKLFARDHIYVGHSFHLPVLIVLYAHTYIPQLYFILVGYFTSALYW